MTHRYWRCSAVTRTRTLRLSRVVLIAAAASCGHDLFTANVDDSTPSPLTLRLTMPRDTSADGASALRVVAHVSGGSTRDRMVTISTSTGSFIPGDAQTAALAFGSSDTAVVGLLAPRVPGVALIRAAAGHLVLFDTIYFRVARAETVLVQPLDSFVLAATPAGQLRLQATLRRSRGLVSPGAEVRFTDSLPMERAGVFSSASLTDAEGRSEVRYTAGVVDSAARGPRRIFACTDRARGGRVCGVTTVFVR